MLSYILEIIDSIGDSIVNFIDIYSFKACLLVGLVALILYIFGYDKGKKIATVSPAVYIVIEIFMNCLLYTSDAADE